MVPDDFKKILHWISQGIAGGQGASFDGVLKETTRFFERIKEVFQTGTEEEKREMMRSLKEMHEVMVAETRALCAKTGMTEEQLASFTENPQNFTTEQWQKIQQARQSMHDSGRVIGRSMERLLSGKPPVQEGGGAKRPQPHKPKKDKWIPS
jgi:Spy/CpxP family protein refolding chaperone